MKSEARPCPARDAQGKIYHPLAGVHSRDLDIEICRRHRVKTLELFGSAVGENFDPAASDLDFVVAFEPMPPVEHADAYLDLALDLEALFSRPVDLVETAPIKNPYFLKAIEESRLPVYAAP